MRYFKNNSDYMAVDVGQEHIIQPSWVEVTKDQIDAEIAEAQQAKFDALSYSEKRMDEYPSIGDQLDALFHAGVFPAEMAATIQAVKDKYPKDVE
jgi:hypothetical protein